jgi:hypothetical protein
VRLLGRRRRDHVSDFVMLCITFTFTLKGRVRFPKRTRRRSCRDSGRPESAEILGGFFGNVVIFFRVFSMGVGFGQGSVPLNCIE